MPNPDTSVPEYPPIRSVSKSSVRTSPLGVTLVVLVVGLLIAGLWPFGSTKNGVVWLTDGNGLEFGRHGTVSSSDRLGVVGGTSSSSCSLELWLQPAKSLGSGTILAFYQPKDSPQFTIRQYMDGLVIELQSWKHRRWEEAEHIYVPGVFERRNSVFLTITADAHETGVYVDGKFVKGSRSLRLSPKDFSGRLVLGTAPVASNSWQGQIRGLAIYGIGLTAGQVQHHFEQWQSTGGREMPGIDLPTSLYLFNEHSGKVVHASGSAGIDLQIPASFVLLHQVRLERPTLAYVDDILLNIAGFIPFGLLLCAYLGRMKWAPWPMVMTILAGACLSLLIESLQSYLPTRDSDLTDVITNTLGTAIGAVTLRWGPVQRLIRLYFA
jgi:hypothetical protein